MTYLERTECLDRLHQLISRRSTGTPKELATKLGVSVSILYSLISDARTLGNDTEHPVILTIISIVLPPILSGWFVRKLIFITKIRNSLSIETHRYHEPVLRSGNKSDDKNS